ncbi:putative bifunctional diguanylate cyclase/phosphodiesterase [Alteromonas sp. 14N.309.X.WAT.G.H12]|uniref:putative bifunctional diguanylate cyclase/phosphodiesterase n=1 Tax=Alteromonas sp. 14N.309.X.WAT.G.H12 TaxID=3120824 RepID=UPI002FD52855
MRFLFKCLAPDNDNLNDIVQILHTNTLGGLLVSVLAISALTFGFESQSPLPIKIYFWLFMVSLLLLRFVDAMYWMKRLRHQTDKAYAAFSRFYAGVTLTALTWGIYTISIFPQMQILELATTMVVLSALAGGAATVLGASRSLVWTFCTLLLVPMSTIALFESHREVNVLGFLGIAFWITMLSSSKRTNHFFTQSMDLKKHNQQLLKLMEAERNEVIRVNTALKNSNLQLDALNSHLEETVQQRTKEVTRLSNLDPLTLLMNRTGFLKQLALCVEKCKNHNTTVALLFIDLDGFKQVNDSLGHAIGDQVLVKVADILKQHAPKHSLARWGGDEFIMIIEDVSSDTAMLAASAIRQDIADPMTIDKNEINLDATIGIALCPEHGDDPQRLIQEADLTMYYEKRLQQSHIAVFNTAIFNSVCREQKLREGLRVAIDENAFYLVYQPIICTDTDSASSFEALIRWQYNNTQVSPNEFIPIAERCGIIVQLGEWVLHTACNDAARWQGTHIAVSVNVSVAQLMEDDFVCRLSHILSSSGLSPTRLHLEVTESVFADNIAKLTAQINGIKAMGVFISIDDFGTGFSSLSQLHNLNFDYIKIDRSFINTLDSTGEPIIRAALLIAGEFGCKTIAEGVETEIQAARLKAMGVDCLQGFYFDKPQREKNLTRWLHNDK